MKTKYIDTPAIVQVKTETDVVKSLKGIKVNASATLIINDSVIRQETGEVLFCDYGLSGPPILQIAREQKLNAYKMEMDDDNYILLPKIIF